MLQRKASCASGRTCDSLQTIIICAQDLLLGERPVGSFQLGRLLLVQCFTSNVLVFVYGMAGVPKIFLCGIVAAYLYPASKP